MPLLPPRASLALPSPRHQLIRPAGVAATARAAVAVGDGQADAVVAVVGRGEAGLGPRERGEGAAVGPGDGPGVGERVDGPPGSVAAALRFTGLPSAPLAGTVNAVIVGATLLTVRVKVVVAVRPPVSVAVMVTGRAGGAVGRGVRPAPGAGSVVLGHRAQRGGQRHRAAALGVVEGAAVRGRAPSLTVTAARLRAIVGAVLLEQHADGVAAVVGRGQVGLAVAVEVPHRHGGRPGPACRS